MDTAVHFVHERRRPAPDVEQVAFPACGDTVNDARRLPQPEMRRVELAVLAAPELLFVLFWRRVTGRFVPTGGLILHV
jgi:hypothetical protein